MLGCILVASTLHQHVEHIVLNHSQCLMPVIARTTSSAKPFEPLRWSFQRS